ncbi:MAG: hypothetical protein M0R40_11480 [Firmicutes bacterium]|nr:hypothetical protein [Bacillota bacterium]
MTRAGDKVVWRCVDRAENGEDALCKNIHSIADLEVGEHVCEKLSLAEFDEDLVRENIGGIVINLGEMEINMSNEIEQGLIL